MAKKSKDKLTTMEKLTEGYEKFIKGKQVKKTGGKLFDKVLNSSVKNKKSK